MTNKIYMFKILQRVNQKRRINASLSLIHLKISNMLRTQYNNNINNNNNNNNDNYWYKRTVKIRINKFVKENLILLMDVQVF